MSGVAAWQGLSSGVRWAEEGRRAAGGGATENRPGEGEWIGLGRRLGNPMGLDFLDTMMCRLPHPTIWFRTPNMFQANAFDMQVLQTRCPNSRLNKVITLR